MTDNGREPDEDADPEAYVGELCKKCLCAGFQPDPKDKKMCIAPKFGSSNICDHHLRDHM